MTFSIEGIGSVLLYLHLKGKMEYFSALFHSISAFCNAGFSLYSDSLMQFKGDIGVNLVIMSLIILGGLGFSVLQELYSYIPIRLKGKRMRLSWHTRVVISTTIFFDFWRCPVYLSGRIFQSQSSFFLCGEDITPAFSICHL